VIYRFVGLEFICYLCALLVSALFLVIFFLDICSYDGYNYLCRLFFRSATLSKYPSFCILSVYMILCTPVIVLT
jgi:hypothetical protein